MLKIEQQETNRNLQRGGMEFKEGGDTWTRDSNSIINRGQTTRLCSPDGNLVVLYNKQVLGNPLFSEFDRSSSSEIH